MKKLLIPLLFVSTPVLAGQWDDHVPASVYANELMTRGARENPIPTYTPPMPETEHYYQRRTPDGDVSREWLRKLD
jgi:hypothetical protein